MLKTGIQWPSKNSQNEKKLTVSFKIIAYMYCHTRVFSQKPKICKIQTGWQPWM
jgi:hypothetical protein